MKWLDIPPIWLVGFILIAWAQARWAAFGFSLGGAWSDLLGGLCVGAGILLMVLALMELRRYRTTPIPHQTASALVTSGIFSRTRNPIYLGDALILLGLILRFDAVLSLPLLPIFVWVLERRFILPEEKALRRAFRAGFARYEQKTRRWV
ncbi:methyltransferase family protein [Ruegeria jejuensis]|uniref:methyltransferase family protein n=1 Tax=Ruegeria jejuensis TaxID=3233338 RepID=UPI00355B7356